MIPLFHGLRVTVNRNYKKSDLFADLTAGIVVALICIPFSLAVSLAINVPPELSIYSMIISCFFGAILGGCTHQISCPPINVIVILAPIAAQYGLRGIIVCQFLASITLILLALLRVGRIVTYIPYTITVGATSGIAVLIFLTSLKDFFGFKIEGFGGSLLEKINAMISNLDKISYGDTLIGIICIAIIMIVPHIRKKLFPNFKLVIPPIIFAIIISSIIASIMNLSGFEVTTIGNKFTYLKDGITHYGIPTSIPKIYLPFFSNNDLFALPTMAEIHALITPAMITVVVIMITSLLSATMADSFTGNKHEPNAELFSTGFSNLLGSFSSGVIMSGAVSRTLANIQLGAKSPLSSVFASLTTLLFIISLAPIANYIPISALATTLLISALQITRVKDGIFILKNSNRSDILVFLCCLTVTIVFDMILGVISSILLSLIFIVKRLAESAKIKVIHYNNKEEHDLPHLPEGVMLYNVSGPLFFGSATFALDPDLINYDGHIKKIIFNFSDVNFIDITGITALDSLCDKYQDQNVEFVICGKKSITKQIHKALAHYNFIIFEDLNFIENEFNKSIA
jgi:sulfate permease, SulP family